ncbi:uncharacterized protein LOC117103971 [Anneissia japonica]|uniref:uncharacterized protein LOC117103971 n=1 Tax=Anneissia japonica TaxID=1529436 RepID=UPI001425B61F|nr:uncharacterized protein LOC117103971 [Anneissia japonica]XP_033100517.1 uncharacterized protein LOC117103971 [Anneissia japonica]
MGTTVDEARPWNISSSVTEWFVTPLRMRVNDILWMYLICCGFLLSTGTIPMSYLQRNNLQLFPIIPPVEGFHGQHENSLPTENRFRESLEDDDEFENYISSGMKAEAERTAKSLRASMAHEMGTPVNEATPSSISSSILEMLKIPLGIRLTVNEKRSLRYFFQSVAGFDDKMAQRLLLHCTSSNQLHQPIRIDYVAVRRGLAKAFTADTNRNVLYIPTTYQSYQDFEVEFKKIVRKNTWWF